MTNTTIALRRQIGSAGDLKSVVRTMKASAASAIGQYERSVAALGDCARTVELGLGVCLRSVASDEAHTNDPSPPAKNPVVHVVVFGSDQGLVGRFNEAVVEHALAQLAEESTTVRLWAVGERVEARLADSGLSLMGTFTVPISVKAIAPLVGQIQIDTEAHQANGDSAPLYVFHNRPQSGSLYEPVSQRLLPLDEEWLRSLAKIAWPYKILPEVMGAGTTTLRALIREYLYISLFRACAESLASENASRLAAMQRADKNIDELLENLHSEFHSLRQSSIDEELFDVVSGYELLSTDRTIRN